VSLLLVLREAGSGQTDGPGGVVARGRSVAGAIDWWIAMTEAGGEGMAMDPSRPCETDSCYDQMVRYQSIPGRAREE